MMMPNSHPFYYYNSPINENLALYWNYQNPSWPNYYVACNQQSVRDQQLYWQSMNSQYSQSFQSQQGYQVQPVQELQQHIKLEQANSETIPKNGDLSTILNLNEVKKPNVTENQEEKCFELNKRSDTDRKIQECVKQVPTIKTGHWTYEEHYQFLKFIEENRELFISSTQKKLNRVFKLMSKLIPTRTACQCRSHYSKFNPFESNGKVRRKLVNDVHVYEKMFDKSQE